MNADYWNRLLQIMTATENPVQGSGAPLPSYVAPLTLREIARQKEIERIRNGQSFQLPSIPAANPQEPGASFLPLTDRYAPGAQRPPMALNPYGDSRQMPVMSRPANVSSETVRAENTPMWPPEGEVPYTNTQPSLRGGLEAIPLPPEVGSLTETSTPSQVPPTVTPNAPTRARTPATETSPVESSLPLPPEALPIPPEFPEEIPEKKPRYFTGSEEGDSRLQSFFFGMAASKNPSLFGMVGEGGLAAQQRGNELRKEAQTEEALSIKRKEEEGNSQYRNSMVDLKTNEQAYEQDPNSLRNRALVTQSQAQASATVENARFREASLELQRSQQAYAQDPNSPQNQAMLERSRTEAVRASTALETLRLTEERLRTQDFSNSLTSPEGFVMTNGRIAEDTNGLPIIASRVGAETPSVRQYREWLARRDTTATRLAETLVKERQQPGTRASALSDEQFENEIAKAKRSAETLVPPPFQFSPAAKAERDLIRRGWNLSNYTSEVKRKQAADFFARYGFSAFDPFDF